jgi:predicted PurR-regulated permease PerM
MSELNQFCRGMLIGIGTCFIVVGLVYFWQRDNENHDREFLAEQARRSVEYTRGFADGMNATLRHVTLVSNTVDSAHSRRDEAVKTIKAFVYIMLLLLVLLYAVEDFFDLKVPTVANCVLGAVIGCVIGWLEARRK